jgi:23S rRNA (cytosine1962-C5)-methyltransferase
MTPGKPRSGDSRPGGSFRGKPADSRGAKPFRKRDDGKPVRKFDKDAKPGASRGAKPWARKDEDGKPAGPRGDKPYRKFDRDSKPGASRGAKPWARKDEDGKPAGPRGDKPYRKFDRDSKPGASRGAKPWERRDADSKPTGPRGDKPYRKVDRDAKPGGYSGDRPYRKYDRDAKPGASRGAKPWERRDTDGKPAAPRGDKPYRPYDRDAKPAPSRGAKPWERRDSDAKPGGYRGDRPFKPRPWQDRAEESRSAPRDEPPASQSLADSPHPEPPRRMPRPQELPASKRVAGAEPRLTITMQNIRTPRVRHIWVFDNMVESLQGEPKDGGTVHVQDTKGRFLGSAVYNSQSRIRARIFSLAPERYDGAYIQKSIAAAVKRRRARYAATESFRVVFADSDGLPGLIVDKLANVLVVQLLTLAADLMRERIVGELRVHFPYAPVVVRTDTQVREKEGLTLGEPHVRGEVPSPLAVEMDGVTLFADPLGGHKTGLFLDQRLNRRLILPHCPGARVADLFCHVGGWALAAARAGAREVVAVDSSEPALALARLGAEATGTPQVRFECAEAFDWVVAAAERGDRYDVVVCDPPAFAKTHAQVEDAIRAYLSLNYRAMKLLPPGGILAACSCSQHVDAVQFEEVLETAARNADLRFQILARGGQPPDHPVLLGFPESDYLKCVVLQRTD